MQHRLVSSSPLTSEKMRAGLRWHSCTRDRLSGGPERGIFRLKIWPLRSLGFSRLLKPHLGTATSKPQNQILEVVLGINIGVFPSTSATPPVAVAAGLEDLSWKTVDSCHNKEKDCPRQPPDSEARGALRNPPASNCKYSVAFLYIKTCLCIFIWHL
jgi:hypothetical protein